MHPSGRHGHVWNATTATCSCVRYVDVSSGVVYGKDGFRHDMVDSEGGFFNAHLSCVRYDLWMVFFFRPHRRALGNFRKGINSSRLSGSHGCRHWQSLILQVGFATPLLQSMRPQ